MKRNLFSFPRSQMVGKMLRAMSFVVAVFWATTAMADIVVKGVVADDSGLPIPGANVTELNSKGNGTITNVDGQYSIVVKGPKSVLRFSFIGYTKEDVTVGNKTQIDVQLSEDSKSLDEVVVIGYGTMRKKDLSGAVASIKSEDLMIGNPTSFSQALQGKLAGVQVNSNDGAPGSGMSITIRGANSFSTSSQPLYIVDGIPFDAGSAPTSGANENNNTTSNPLSLINPNDIESIDVLKDASATAIYGSRGANGVVLVTTKKGVEGKVQIYADVAIGVSNILKKYDLLNAYEYATALKEYNGISFADDEMEAYKNGSKGIDWQNLMLQTGISQDYKLGISGGTAKNKYLISANVLNMTAMTITTKYQRAQLRINLDNELTKWLTLSTKINASRTHSHNGGIDIMNFLNYSPTMEMKDPVTGVYNMDPYNSVNGNPYGARVANYGDSYVYALNTNMDLTFKIMKGLTLSVQGAANYSHVPSYSFTSSLAKPGQISGMENAVSYTHLTLPTT